MKCVLGTTCLIAFVAALNIQYDYYEVICKEAVNFLIHDNFQILVHDPLVASELLENLEEMFLSSTCTAISSEV